jgi:hypothetical protein
MIRKYAIYENATNLGLTELSTDYALYYNTTASNAFIMDGFLYMGYDGIYPVRATSAFNFHNSGFEVSAELRQAFDPIFFSIFNSQNTATFKISDGDYTCSLLTGGETYNCWGHLNLETSVENQYFTDYICVSSADIENKNFSLTYLIEDPTDIAINVIGGTSQRLNVDFYVQDNKIYWDDSMRLDGELNPGDILRVIYLARGLSNPAQIKFVLKDNAMTTYGLVNGHYTKLMKRALHSPSTGPWKTSFYMDTLAHTGTQMGRGYVSKFLAIADSFTNTDKAKPYKLKTWRQPVIVYK